MSTSPTSRSRRPAGTPTGGQFAPEAHAEPEVALGATPSDQSPGSRREVDVDGTVLWYDADGQLHRDGGPAIEGPDGHQEWYQHGKPHRDGGPAIEGPGGSTFWYQHGQLHRDGGPAVEWADGTKEWYQHGQIHRDGGPAVEWADGTKLWYQHDKLHRDDGPAVEHADGTKEWYQHDKLHRDDGPAVEHADGTKEWRQHGQLHRDDGPAAEYADGTTAWWQHGQRLPEVQAAINRLVDIASTGQTWDDIGPALTCTEADAFADVFRAAGFPEVAERLLGAHSTEDEEGDMHFDGEPELD